MVTKIEVEFDPLRITLPGAGPFSGEIWFILPEVHLNVVDLALTGCDLLEGAHIGAEGKFWGLKTNLPEPGITADQVTRLIEEAEPLLKRVWEICDRESRKPRRKS
jgi:hypothetical protein